MTTSPDVGVAVYDAADETAQQSGRSSLRRNFAWTLTGIVAYSAAQWALLAAIARTATPEEVGRFALGLAITGPLFTAGQLHLRSIQATDAANRFRFGDYLYLRAIATAAALAASAFCVLAWGLGPQAAGAVLLVAAWRAFDAMSDVYHGALQQRERMARIGKSMALRSGLLVGAVIAAMLVASTATAAAAAAAVSAAVVFLAYDRRSVVFDGDGGADKASAARPAWNGAACRSLFRLAVPLALVMMLISLNQNVPRYFLEWSQGEASLGIFAALFYLVVAGNTAVTACGQAVAPRLARYHAAGEAAAFNRLVTQLVALGAACGAVGVAAAAVAGHPILNALYGPAYAAHHRLLVGLMGAAGLLYLGQFLGYAMTAARLFRSQVPLFAAVTLVTALTCWLLVPARGLEGAVWATAAGAATQLAGSAAILQFGRSRSWA